MRIVKYIIPGRGAARDCAFGSQTEYRDLYMTSQTLIKDWFS